tara:strand:- start:219 stop:404 length:186 start_codon:yes stop_codon:yes gene_type:complete
MENVIKHLKDNERSLSWLSRRLGMSRVTLSTWASGKVAPSRAYKLAMSYVLNVPYEELFKE